MRAVKDGGSFRVPARSEHEMALFKKKIREIAPKVENGLKIRFKDEIRRRRHAVTKEWVTRTNFNFMVYKASTGQAQATNGLQKGRGSN